MRIHILGIAAVCAALVMGCADEPDLALNNPADPESSTYIAVDAGGPYAANLNTPITFRGTASNAYRRITRYEWDFDGNGTYDWSSMTGGSATYTYTSFGSYQPMFRVIDNDGNTVTASTTLILTASINFSRSSDLDLFTTHATTGTYTVYNGALQITGTSDQYIAQARLKNSSFVTNGTIEVKTTYHSGATNYSYGIRFRCPTSGGGYGFSISPKGSYVVGKWSALGECSALKNWTSSTYINKYGTNTLKVVMQGSIFEFFINGYRVSQVTDTSYKSGDVGLYVDTSGMAVEFDDFVVSPQAGKPARIDSITKTVNGDYRLSPGSPCIDAGNPASPLDPDGTRADMGAIPYQH